MKHVVVLTLAVITVFLSASSGQPARERLAVRIVPSRHDEKMGRGIELYGASQHFQVVVTNVSDQDLLLWREWCGWGYFNLSFAVTGEEGRPVTVSKRPRGWDKNYPDSMIVPPGEHLVFEVTFDDAIWQNSPLNGLNGSKTVKIQAFFEIRADEQTKEKGVWTGRVASPTDTYALWR